jgi:hypothetical protein
MQGRPTQSKARGLRAWRFSMAVWSLLLREALKLVVMGFSCDVRLRPLAGHANMW